MTAANSNVLPMETPASIDSSRIARFPVIPTPEERYYLMRGLAQPGGKLPLFDRDGQPVHPALVRNCLAQGWVEPWFVNPLKPDWLVCKLTEKGRQALTD